MAFEFKLPDLGEGLTEGEIVKWLVKVGDLVEEGQVFVQVETDKAIIEIPSPKKGMVLKLGAAEGETVQVRQVIIVLGEPGEKLAAIPEPEKEVKVRPSVGVVGELEEAPEEVEEKVERKEAEILAVPMVRKLARDLEVDLRTVKGSGPQGRITKEDVIKAAREKKPPEKAVPEKAIKVSPKHDLYGYIERVPLRGMHKTIAQSMVKSKSTIPHAAGMDEADVTQLIALKVKAKERAAQKKIHLTILPFVIKAVVAALEEHPYLNSSLDEESSEIILKKYYNIGVAVDTKDGLMVPVVKNAKGKNIFHLAGELTELSEKARNRTIDLADLKGGTFTITNFGAMGGTFGFPIIRHPEVAILGMGKILEKPVVVEGKIEVRKVLPLSLSFDHRVVDGAEAVRFMNTVIELLEDPGLILMEE
ncbi:MAG: 2-oxo acid dehydrogenase subunit E2 [Deltaproteobacteria bacterium]|nr:2-oxo acid dehydrogenase subunit E2 [Deltaproteobacteria bacterium]